MSSKEKRKLSELIELFNKLTSRGVSSEEERKEVQGKIDSTLFEIEVIKRNLRLQETKKTKIGF